MEIDLTPSAGGSEANDSDNLFGNSPPENSAQPSPAGLSDAAQEAPPAAAPPNDAAPAEPGNTDEAYAERQRLKSQQVYDQITKLNGTDLKCAKLLSVASEAMEAVHPTHREPGGDPASMWSHETTAAEVKAKADEYYGLLNVRCSLFEPGAKLREQFEQDIQIDLRHTIRALRRNKVSVLPVTASQQHQMQGHGQVATGAVHPPNAETGSSGLGLGATRMQSSAWKDVRLGLEEVLRGMEGTEAQDSKMEE